MKIAQAIRLHACFFNALENITKGWFMGGVARLIFSSVTLMFFLNSASTKVGDGFPGVLIPEVAAYAQMLPPVAEAAGYDADLISFFPWGIIAHLGTYAEFLLPIMIFMGLFTRLSSLAMIGFIAVMSFVDIQFHGLEAESIGSFFDRVQDSMIADQRLLWIVPLLYLVTHGPGILSLDYVFKGRTDNAG